PSLGRPGQPLLAIGTARLHRTMLPGGPPAATGERAFTSLVGPLFEGPPRQGIKRPTHHYTCEEVMPDERDLVRKILAGDQEAQTLFYRENARRLYHICIHFLGPEDDDADDIVQQTF